jgi:hypothetical protein
MPAQPLGFLPTRSLRGQWKANQPHRRPSRPASYRHWHGCIATGTSKKRRVSNASLPDAYADMKGINNACLLPNLATALAAFPISISRAHQLTSGQTD